MKAKQQCGSQPSQWRLKDFVLWVLVSYQANTTSQPNSSSCVPAFQPSIFSLDPTYFPACHTAQSCAQTLSQSFLPLSLPFSFLCAIFFSLSIWLTNFTSPLREEKKKKQLPSLPLFASVSQSIFFTFPAPFLSLSFLSVSSAPLMHPSSLDFLSSGYNS